MTLVQKLLTMVSNECHHFGFDRRLCSTDQIKRHPTNTEYNQIASQNRLYCMLLYVCTDSDIALVSKISRKCLHMLTAGNVSFIKLYVISNKLVNIP